ncbi:MAG: SPOR domain-containing protein [Pseudomonadota bacterium]|nr:SPOR domain-containing protein [Pseudomonadota bacterium]
MFADAARAETLRQHLDAEGIRVHDEIVHGPRGRFTLVRAGPFASRAAADEVLARARGLGENAFLGHQ